MRAPGWTLVGFAAGALLGFGLAEWRGAELGAPSGGPAGVLGAAPPAGGLPPIDHRA